MLMKNLFKKGSPKRLVCYWNVIGIVIGIVNGMLMEC